MSSFYDYFKENMEGLGLSAPPPSLFGTQQLAVSTIAGILAYIDKFGTKVTMGELVGAGTKIEQLAVLGSLGAAFYAGAAIRSLAVATGETLSGGTSLSDVIYEASKWKLNRDWLRPLLSRQPGIYDRRIDNRARYKHHG